MNRRLSDVPVFEPKIVLSYIYEFINYIKHLNVNANIDKEKILMLKEEYDKIMNSVDPNILKDDEVQRLLFALSYEYNNTVQKFLEENYIQNTGNQEAYQKLNSEGPFKYVQNSELDEFTKQKYDKLFERYKESNDDMKESTTRKELTSSNDNKNLAQDHAFDHLKVNNYIRNLSYHLQKLFMLSKGKCARDKIEASIKRIKEFISEFNEIVNITDISIEKDNEKHIEQLRTSLSNESFKELLSKYPDIHDFCQQIIQYRNIVNSQHERKESKEDNDIKAQGNFNFQLQSNSEKFIYENNITGEIRNTNKINSEKDMYNQHDNANGNKAALALSSENRPSHEIKESGKPVLFSSFFDRHKISRLDESKSSRLSDYKDMDESNAFSIGKEKSSVVNSRQDSKDNKSAKLNIIEEEDDLSQTKENNKGGVPIKIPNESNRHSDKYKECEFSNKNDSFANFNVIDKKYITSDYDVPNKERLKACESIPLDTKSEVSIADYAMSKAIKAKSTVVDTNKMNLTKIIPDITENYFKKYKYVMDPLLMGHLTGSNFKDLYHLAKKQRREIAKKAIRVFMKNYTNRMSHHDKYQTDNREANIDISYNMENEAYNNGIKNARIVHKMSEAENNYHRGFNLEDNRKKVQVKADILTKTSNSNNQTDKKSDLEQINKLMLDLLGKTQKKIRAANPSAINTKHVDKSFGPYSNNIITLIANDNSNNWNLFQWKRISHIYRNEFVINLQNAKVRFINADLSNTQLLTIFMSLHKFGDVLIKSWIKEFDMRNGKIILQSPVDNDLVELDDFLPIQLNNTITGDFECFTFPFVSPIEELKNINPFFCILEKYCAKVAGNYCKLGELKFDDLIKLFCSEIEKVDLNAINDFTKAQFDEFFEDLYNDSKDSSRILYFASNNGEVKYCKFILPESKEFLLEDINTQKNYTLPDLKTFFDYLIIGKYYID